MNTKRISPGAAFAAAVLASVLAVPAAAQLNLPRPSPGSTVKQTIGVTDATVDYSRPSVKGRTIWGELVPWDKPWRTGANSATTITFSNEVMIGGKKLPAGTYALYTIPGKTEWTVAFNSDAKAQIGSWDEKKDAVRVAAKAVETAMTETLTIGFENVTTKSADLAISWDKAKVSVKIETDTDAQAMASAKDAIEKAKADDWRTPMQAANYMAEQKNMDVAEKWMAKSIAVNDNYHNNAAKARMLAGAGKKREAIAAGERALSLIPKTEPKPGDEGVANFKKQMAEWGGAKS